jgi:hypothetical protein
LAQIKIQGVSIDIHPGARVGTSFCIDHGKHVVAVIKGDQRALLQDAQGLFAQRKPGLWEEPRRLTEFWDEEGFTSAEGVKARLRVLHAHETVTRRRRIAKEWLEDIGRIYDWWWATTFPPLATPQPSILESGAPPMGCGK